MLQHLSKFRGLTSKLVLCLTAALAAPALHAGVVEIDWKTPGDKLIVKDQETGLEFLKLKASFNQNYTQVSQQLGTGGQFAGFRYATWAELNTMLSHVPLPTIPDYRNGFTQTTISQADFDRFSALFGTVNQGWGPQAYGFVADLHEGRRVTPIYSHDVMYGMQPRTAITTYPDGFTFYGHGSWLVRQGVAGPVVTIADLLKEIEELDAELATAKATITSLQGQLATANARVTALETQLASAQAANATLASEKTALAQQLATATAANTKLQTDLTAANTRATSLETQLTAVQATLAQRDAQLAAAKAENTTLSAALAAANALNAQLQASLAAQSTTVTTLSSTLGSAVGDSSFQIPGTTVEQQVATLSTAISGLNPGQKQALYKNLGGKK